MAAETLDNSWAYFNEMYRPNVYSNNSWFSDLCRTLFVCSWWNRREDYWPQKRDLLDSK